MSKAKEKPPAESEENLPGAKKSISSTGYKYTEKSARNYLNRLLLDESRRKYPSAPYHTPRKFNVRSTNGLTGAVLAFLRLKGHHVERSPNEGRLVDDREVFTDAVGITRTVGSVYRIPGQGMRGTSDLKAIIAGRAVCIEIKNRFTHDRQRPDQKEYQARVEASGGVYVLVRDFPGFLNWYEAFAGGPANG